VGIVSADLQLINEGFRLQHRLPLTPLGVADEDRLMPGAAGSVRCARPERGASLLRRLRLRVQLLGYARERAVRERGGQRRFVRPRRVRCRGCRVTHVLLPALIAPRRTDSAHVILGALLARANGRGHRSIAAELSLQASTVPLAAARDCERRTDPQ
jgi:hypothetical protein